MFDVWHYTNAWAQSHLNSFEQMIDWTSKFGWIGVLSILPKLISLVGKKIGETLGILIRSWLCSVDWCLNGKKLSRNFNWVAFGTIFNFLTLYYCPLYFHGNRSLKAWEGILRNSRGWKAKISQFYWTIFRIFYFQIHPHFTFLSRFPN